MTRVLKTLAALAIAGASTLCLTSQASADPNPNNHGSAGQWAVLRTSHDVGIYSSPDAGSSKFNNLTLTPGNDNAVWVDCWVVGGNVYGDGDVWYRTENAYQNHN